LALHTGMRAKELFDLTWGNVDLENGLITIQDSKSVEPRYVYLTEDTKAMLAGLQNNQAKNELVFKDRKGHKIKEVSNAFGKAVKALRLNEGINDRRQRVCFHTLRHTFASWLVQSGTDLYTVKKLLGHSSILLTERYSHLQPDGLQQTISEFDKKMNTKCRIVNIQDAKVDSTS
ncbi:MAG: site-specific integrase, partial [Deltaproteobacteria bacterium]